MGTGQPHRAKGLGQSVPGIDRDCVTRLYFDFLETAEKKRHWNVFDDIPWNVLDREKIADTTADCIELYCAEELYTPDYTIGGLTLLRTMFGLAWFQIRWAFEESMHGLVFRNFLSRSGLRTEAELTAIETSVAAKAWTLPFETTRKMACYGAIQESATYIAYRAQKERAAAAGDEVLEAIFFHVGRDEAAHSGFYRSIIGLELSSDREGTVADLAYVLSNFKMPGDGLIPDYRQRLASSGAGISSRVFLERVVWPLLTTLQIGRAEMKTALRKSAGNGANVPVTAAAS
jgi:acyl-[acyl-carrier-protein] desaturase